MRLRTALGVSLVVSVVSLAFAAADKSQSLHVPLNVKLGLWQMSYTTERNGTAPGAPGIAAGLLAKMTPEQRARTGARLRAKAAAGPHIETKQYCVTADRLKLAIFNNEEIQSCQRTMLTSSATLQQFHDECVASGTKRTAEGRFEALDFDTMKGLLKIKAEGTNPFTMSVEIAGRWVANDCGDSAP
jgi:hypothetical protein